MTIIHKDKPKFISSEMDVNRSLRTFRSNKDSVSKLAREIGVTLWLEWFHQASQFLGHKVHDQFTSFINILFKTSRLTIQPTFGQKYYIRQWIPKIITYSLYFRCWKKNVRFKLNMYPVLCRASSLSVHIQGVRGCVTKSIDVAVRLETCCDITGLSFYRFLSWYLSVIHRLFPVISPSHNRQIAFTFLK